jgi:hypothetical protein
MTVVAGQRVGAWEVVEVTGRRAYCRCVCGNVRQVAVEVLASGESRPDQTRSLLSVASPSCRRERPMRCRGPDACRERGRTPRASRAEGVILQALNPMPPRRRFGKWRLGSHHPGRRAYPTPVGEFSLRDIGASISTGTPSPTEARRSVSPMGVPSPSHEAKGAM